MIQIQHVLSNAQLRDFVRFPVRLYKGNPYFVSRPFFELKSHLSSKNPFYNTADVALFVAYEGDGKTPCGRISVQLNRKAGHMAGQFGFLDAVNEDVLQALLKHAEEFLKDNGCDKIYGPFSLSINDVSGLLVDGFDKKPRLMMPYGQDWYGKVLEGCGYAKAKDLLAFDVATDVTLPKSARYMARQAEKIEGLTERAIDMKHFSSDMQQIVEIFNNAWSENWGFIPMSDDDMQYMAHNIKPVIIPDLARIAFIDSKPVAMVVALPDVNEALHGLDGKLLPFNWVKLLYRLKVKGVRTGRILLMGVMRDIDPVRSSAISTLLVQKIQDAALRQNIDTIEMSWILDDNEPTKRLITAMGGVESRRYRVYEKGLSL